MARVSARALERLARATPQKRGAAARTLLQTEAAWAEWLPAFNELHVRAPEKEAAAAAALAAAAGRARRPVLAARLRLIEGRARHRCDAPGNAVRALRRAARALRAVGDPARVTQAEVLTVDALALAGRVEEALRLADDVRPRIRGPQAPAWRAALAVNRANALRLAGDLKAAVRTYARAARALDKLGDAHTAAIARANAGTALVDAGDADRARAYLEGAARVFEQAGQTDPALEVRYNLAGALVKSGRLGEGLAELERLEDAHQRRGLARRAALCRMDLADALLRAGDCRAAEESASAAAEAFRRCGAHAERVEALWIAAAAAPADPRRAGRHLDRATRAAVRAERTSYALRCELLKLDAACRRGRLASTAKLAGLRRQADALGQKALVAETWILQGHVALERGRARDALRCFGQPLLRRPGRPWVRAAAEAGRALAEAKLGRRGAAINRLRRVGSFLDHVRRGLPGAWLRTAFVLDRLDPYLVRVDLLLARGLSKDRQEAADVLDSLAARRFLEREPHPRGRRDLAELRRRLEAVYERLSLGDTTTRGIGVHEGAALEREAGGLERRVAELWRRGERRRKPGPGFPVADSRSARIPPGVTAVRVWIHGSRVLGLARGVDGVRAHAELGTTDEVRAELELARFHEARAPRSRSACKSLDHSLARLATRLLVPLGVEAWDEHVWLVLDPELADAPWEVLPFAGRPLAARHQLLRVPALQIRRSARRRATGTTVVGLGDEGLPGTVREALDLSRRARVVSGDQASRDAVVRALAESDVVHLTGHGFDAPEAPGLGGVRLADGWFGATDLPATVRARLVVLAACRTGRVEGLAGRAWGGLVSALLAAGAQSVVWTSADVEDGVTADLMHDFHRARRRQPVARAFGSALARTGSTRGHASGLLAFHLSGIPS